MSAPIPSPLLAPLALALLAALPLAATAGAAAAAAAATTTELIPRTALFGNPERAGARISPDGRYLSWLAPVDGVMNVWVAPSGQPGQARPVTHDRARGIDDYVWSYRSGTLLYLRDDGGDENFHLYAVDVAAPGRARDLTPYPKTRARLVRLAHRYPDAVLVGMNDRDGKWHDLYRVDLASGERRLVHRNEQRLGSYRADGALTLRMATRALPDGGEERLVPDGKDWKVVDTIPFEDIQTSELLDYSDDGRLLYATDSRGRDTSALYAIDADGGKTLLLEDPRADVGAVLADPASDRVQAVAVTYLRRQWQPLERGIAADLERLQRQLGPGDFSVVSRTFDDRTWIVTHGSAEQPTAVYRYDRVGAGSPGQPAAGQATSSADERGADQPGADQPSPDKPGKPGKQASGPAAPAGEPGRLTRLFSTRPALDGKPLAPMHPLELRSRDGKTLVSYLTLPPGSDADGDGRPERPVPLVLTVHGGPWARDHYGFSGTSQWLANRGYAQLKVNFRGSTGFGKRFINAADKEWAGKMHEDLLDAVSWAVEHGVTTPDQVAIMGGSYGGYATLVGLSFTPDRFKCGVDIVGPSNLETLLNTIPPYWASIFEQFVQRMGDPRTEAGRKLLAERSPISRVDKISKPLLIGQGANDPRVKQAESDQIVQAMQRKRIPVTYVLFPDEGHGFARQENALAFNAVAEGFLGQCLGGRVQPIGQDFQGSSLTVPAGADGVDGLEQALERHTPQSRR